jgi:glutathione peroxidase-family protein
MNIEWNFETKFLVSPDGITVSRYSEAYEPIKLIESVKFYSRKLSKTKESL